MLFHTSHSYISELLCEYARVPEETNKSLNGGYIVQSYKVEAAFIKKITGNSPNHHQAHLKLRSACEILPTGFTSYIRVILVFCFLQDKCIPHKYIQDKYIPDKYMIS